MIDATALRVEGIGWGYAERAIECNDPYHESPVGLCVTIVNFMPNQERSKLIDFVAKLAIQVSSRYGVHPCYMMPAGLSSARVILAFVHFNFHDCSFLTMTFVYSLVRVLLTS